MSGRRLALVVATDHYDDPTLHGLAAPGADAEALADVLGDPDRGEFEVDVLRNPTSWVTAERVEALLSQRHPADLVLLHFSCHGLKDESGELFLAASNTTPSMLASTAVDASLVNRLMRRSRAQRVVLLLDCCYGGAFERGVMTRGDNDVHVGGQFSQGQLGGGRGRVVITASSAMEYALEGTDLTFGGRPTPSLFTGALVDGLRSGEADRDQDGQVGLDELYDYVFERVQQRTPNQTPSRWEFGLQGDLFIARNPRRRIVPSALTTDILELAHHATPGVRIGAIDELTQIAGGTHLQRAAGAVLLLRQLLDDDSRRVAEAAATVLAGLAPKPSRDVVDLGRIAVGTTSVEDVLVEGSPLALVATIETSGPQIQARLQRSVLHIDVAGSTPGPLRGWVTLTGPAGTQRIDVTAEVIAATGPPTRSGVPTDAGVLPPDGQPGLTSSTPAPEPPHLPPLRPTPTDLVRPQQAATKRANLTLMAVLVIAGAAAIVGANLLPAEWHAFRDFSGRQGSWWLFLPAGAATVSLLGLLLPRAGCVAMGIIAGTAAWSGALWLKVTVTELLTQGPDVAVQGSLNTGLWARLVSFVLLGAVVVISSTRYEDLRAPVTLARDRWAVVAGFFVLSGAAILLVDPLTRSVDGALPREATLAVTVIAGCLPVAVMWLGSDQRLAALTAVTVFLFFTGGKDAWLVIGGQLDSHLAGNVSGLLAALVGCYVGQCRLRGITTDDTVTQTSTSSTRGHA